MTTHVIRFDLKSRFTETLYWTGRELIDWQDRAERYKTRAGALRTANRLAPYMSIHAVHVDDQPAGSDPEP